MRCCNEFGIFFDWQLNLIVSFTFAQFWTLGCKSWSAYLRMLLRDYKSPQLIQNCCRVMIVFRNNLFPSLENIVLQRKAFSLPLLLRHSNFWISIMRLRNQLILAAFCPFLSKVFEAADIWCIAQCNWDASFITLKKKKRFAWAWDSQTWVNLMRVRGIDPTESN